MNPILSEILSSPWLISKERSTAYASMLLSLLKSERISEEDSSIAREKNRSFVIAATDNGDQRFGFSDEAVPENSIAIIPVRSEILKYDQPCGPRGTKSITNEIKFANSNSKIGSILLIVDSPGGQVTFTDLLSEAIRDCKKPVVAFVEGMAASAAYWIISGCDKIIASSDLDRIGSIGTMLMVEDLQPYFESQGVKFHEVYATLSEDKNKDFNEVLDGNYKSYQKNVLDVINSKFLSSVKANRSGVDESALSGKIYFAPEAISLGLIDEIGSFEYALSVASSLVLKTKDLSNENQSNAIEPMKIKDTWKAIAGFFKLDPADLEAQELTVDRVQLLNDELANVMNRNQDLESRLADEIQAHSKTKAVLTALEAEDAADPIVAAKEKDEISGASEEPVYAHDKIADDFCS